MHQLGRTNLEIFPLCFGTNICGWTIDEAESFKVLDSYTSIGGNFIDTADKYSTWVEGHPGGESEAIIGSWLRKRRNRDEIILATKVNDKPDRLGMAPETLRLALDESLRRLGVDHVDLLYAHRDDPATPLVDGLAAMDRMVQEGKVRHLGASNYSAERLREALAVQKRENLAPFEVFQPRYNLLSREYEGALRAVCVAEAIPIVSYFSLASGALTGKYREPDSVDGTPRENYVKPFLTNPRVNEVLDALERIAFRHGVSMGAVALAWIAAQPTVGAPISSARSPEQLEELQPMVEFRFAAEELQELDALSSLGSYARE